VSATKWRRPARPARRQRFALDTTWRRPDRQPSQLMPNLGMIGGRVQAVLGAPCGTSALLADLSLNLQSISRARIRLSVAYPLTACIRLHAVLGGVPCLETLTLPVPSLS
jgi:hypothetical protein